MWFQRPCRRPVTHSSPGGSRDATLALGPIDDEQLWETLEYFLQRAVPLRKVPEWP